MTKFKIENTFQCEMDWNKMPIIGSERHCSSCDKKLTDYSTFSDLQLSKLIKAEGSLGCGRFSKSQLNREISFPKKDEERWLTNFSLVALISGSTLTSLATSDVYGQASISKNKLENIEVSGFNFNRKSSSNSITISGKVIDQNDSTAMIGAVVSILEMPTRGCIADFNGYYSLTIPVDELPGSITLQFSFIGYHDVIKTLEINQNLEPRLDVELVQGFTIVCNLEAAVVGMSTITIKRNDQPSTIKRIIYSPARLFRRCYRFISYKLYN